MTNAAVEAIDLFTCNDEDPYIIHEPACQNCHTKQSETQLTRCSGCSFVWYCSEACVEADFDQHGKICISIERTRAVVHTSMHELREEHQIGDPFVHQENIPFVARNAHTNLEEALTIMAKNVSDLSQQGMTKELWELQLQIEQNLFQLKERRSVEGLHTASGISFVLIRLDRLEDAWCFIRNTLTTYRSYDKSSPAIEYQPQDHYNDCLEWVCSSYWPSLADDDFERVRKQLHNLILALIIIKLRIRVTAARDAWKDTINVFLQTKQGKEMEPARFALEECFSLSDDSVQVEQIRQLISIIHDYDSSMIPDILNSSYEGPLRNAFTCLHRTPQGPELLSMLLNSEVTYNRLDINSESLVDLLIYNRFCSDDARTRARKRHAMLVIMLIIIFAFARMVLIPGPNSYSRIGVVIAYVSLCFVTIDITDAWIILMLYFLRGRHFEEVGQIKFVIVWVWVWASFLATQTADFDMHFLFMSNKWDWMLLMAVCDLIMWLWVPTVPSEPLFGLKDMVWSLILTLCRWNSRLAEAVWIVKSTMQHWCVRLSEYGGYAIVPAQ